MKKMLYYNVVASSFSWENTPSYLLALTDITARVNYE